MRISLHKNATTTPAVRAAIQPSSACGYELACQDGVSQTMRRWRKRNSLHEASPTPHRLQTALNAAQEASPRTPRGSMRSIPCVKPWASSSA